MAAGDDAGYLCIFHVHEHEPLVVVHGHIDKDGKDRRVRLPAPTLLTIVHVLFVSHSACLSTSFNHDPCGKAFPYLCL
eukprot:scaffold137329_cov19-Prasinocladus_malaysianus.AAC.1